MSLLLVLGVACAAAPTTYKISFNRSGGTSTVAPLEYPDDTTFDYDPATGTFTNFLVHWKGGVYDFAAMATNPSTLGYLGGALHASCPVPSTSQAVFQWLTGALPAGSDANGNANCFPVWTAATDVPSFTGGTVDVFSFGFCSNASSTCTNGFIIGSPPSPSIAWIISPPDGLYVVGNSPDASPQLLEVGAFTTAEVVPATETPEPGTFGLAVAAGVLLRAVTRIRRSS